jgi:hypothetical protein
LICVNADETGKDAHESEECSYKLLSNQFYKFYGADGATLADSYNADEWKTASRLQESPSEEKQENKETFEKIEISENQSLPIYNPGDKKADLKIVCSLKGTKDFPGAKLTIFSSRGEEKFREMNMSIKPFPLEGEDVGIIIDSHTHLISGIAKNG